MSVSYRKASKARKAARTQEERELRNRIRNGVMPSFHFAKNKDMNTMETTLVWKGRFLPPSEPGAKPVKAMEPKRTWRQVSTIAVLIDKEPKS